MVGRLLRDASGARDRAWLLRYFAARRAPGPIARVLPDPPEDGVLNMRQFSAPLHVAVDSGGLVTYYEIVLRRVYSPTPAWVPSAGQTVIDVGANIGVFALWAAGLVGAEGTLVAV